VEPPTLSKTQQEEDKEPEKHYRVKMRVLLD
jgi:hypothetical protein